MKKFLVMAVAALMAVSAFAQTIPASWNVDWYVDRVCDPNDASVGIMVNYSIMWDLCWSASVDKSGEVVLASRIFDSGSEFYTDTDNASIYPEVPTFDTYMIEWEGSGTCRFLVEGTGSTSPGYIWQRIIAVSDSPNGTDYIWDGDAVQVTAVTSVMQTPTGLDGNFTTVSGDLWSIYSPAPIPEPATMSLLGLGALAMVLRRKLRK